MENIWQFSKVYPKVTAITRLDKKTKDVLWQHPSEEHITDGEINKNYREWRKKGMNNEHVVRYPVNYKEMKTCLYALADVKGKINTDEKLDYIQARKKIYIPTYCNLVKKHDLFKKLQEKHQNGENLLIIEVDGPHQEDLEYYKSKYNVDDKFIENDTMLVNKKNIRIMLNDPKHPFISWFATL